MKTQHKKSIVNILTLVIVFSELDLISNTIKYDIKSHLDILNIKTQCFVMIHFVINQKLWNSFQLYKFYKQ